MTRGTAFGRCDGRRGDLARLLVLLSVTVQACTGDRSAGDPATIADAAIERRAEDAFDVAVARPSPFDSTSDRAGGAVARPSFEARPCPTYDGRAPRNVTCGYVAVPEARTGAGSGRMIDVAVAIITGGAPPRAPPDPILYLTGGPGGSAWLEILEDLALREREPDPFSEYRAGRSVFLVDPRGSGYSRPRLTCPEFASLVDFTAGTGRMMQPRGASEASMRAADSCRARLVSEGIDLAQYTTSATADDLEDIRRAFGIAQWNVYGVSYGTRVALELVRRHPNTVRSLMLDSVLPPDADLMADRPLSFERSLKMVLAACSADDACRTSFPDLEGTLVAVLQNLASSPVPLTLIAPTKVELTPGLLLDLLARELYDRAFISSIPVEISEYGKGRFSMAASRLFMFWAHDRSTTDGHYLSVMCADEVAFSTRRGVLAAGQRLEAPLRPWLPELSMFDLCDRWNVPRAAPEANEPVSSTVPALVLAGDLDPVTPPAYADLAARTLVNSQVFLFRATAHGASFNRCARGIMRDFLADPTRRLNATCPAEIPPLRFRLIP